jgi:FixJ family two-component response regulator
VLAILVITAPCPLILAVPVVIISGMSRLRPHRRPGHGNVQIAVEAMKEGAIDFIEKPFSDEVVIESIGKAAKRAAQRGQADAALKTIAFELGISNRTVEVYPQSRVHPMRWGTRVKCWEPIWSLRVLTGIAAYGTGSLAA